MVKKVHMNSFITHNQKETQELGRQLAQKLTGGEVLCLEGELGAGKTTFTQGLLAELEVEGPYTSPTFLIMKEYEREIQNPKSKISNSKIRRIYHIDAYRINEEDLLNLGWEEIINDKNNVVIVEWPDRVRKILPQTAMEIGFEWLDENQRKIMFT